MGWFRKTFGKVAAKIGSNFVGGLGAATGLNPALKGFGGKPISMGRDDSVTKVINKNGEVLRDATKVAGVVALGAATGGVALGTASGAALGAGIGGAYGGLQQKARMDLRAAEDDAREAESKLRAGAVAPMAGEGATVGAAVGDDIAVVDPVEEAAKRARAKASKRVFGSGLGSNDKLGSTGSLGSGI